MGSSLMWRERGESFCTSQTKVGESYSSPGMTRRLIKQHPSTMEEKVQVNKSTIVWRMSTTRNKCNYGKPAPRGSG